MSEAHDQLLIEFEQQERWRDLLGEVLAVLNGDGGHYQTEHGAGRAAIEGIRRYYQLLARLDALEAAVLDLIAFFRNNVEGRHGNDAEGEPCDLLMETEYHGPVHPETGEELRCTCGYEEFDAAMRAVLPEWFEEDGHE